MKDNKRLKDPIYGYVNIPLEYMTDIIDTSSFQRLRRIIQTSYSPLYSSAVHNRFVHSIGVFHLGELASKQLVQEVEKKTPEIEIKKSQKVFMLACLLHDVGHAPFSHTGEQFYLGESGSYGSLHERLKQCVQNEQFDSDIPINETEAAASHEIMSAIVGLKEFGAFFADDEDRAFFARCITGYKYQKNSSENQIKNCFISLLNSNTIDVDKLDYLIRDAYITGFDTVNIDYERLLTALTVVNISGSYQLGYYKSAISVIENVIYAHDSERKWIQSHPIVLYEGYILQHTIADLCRTIAQDGKQLFSEASLSKTGQTFLDGVKVKLLCDDDIVYLMKNVYPSDISSEFFERRSRRHPLWKSEAEYKAFFTQTITGGTILDRFESAMEDTAKIREGIVDTGKCSA